MNSGYICTINALTHSYEQTVNKYFNNTLTMKNNLFGIKKKGKEACAQVHA